MNTFGNSSNQFPLYDRRSVIENRARFQREAIPALTLANSFYCPTGREQSRGWLLLARKDYNELNKYATNLTLHIGNPLKPHNVDVLQNLAIVQAQCVTRGIAADEDALYLVEITDARGILHNRWFQFPITAQYNIRAPAYPQTFHPASMNSGTTWTWSTMLQNIWETMPLLGTWPGIPTTPSGTPEGFWFVGVSAWTALNDVLEHIGLTVACDLTSSTPFTIVDDGAPDATLTAAQALYATNLEDDLEWIDTGAARVPKTVKVFFRRRNSIYGTEETVTYRSDSPYQWDMSSVYTVSVTAPATFASAVGTHHIWSDFTVRYDMDNQPLSADTAIASAIASERVTQYFDRIYSRTSGYMDQTYATALPFANGSQVDAVRWYQSNNYSSRMGWRTRIMRGDTPNGIQM